MLTLAGRFEVGGFALFRDRAAGSGGPAFTSRVYAVRLEPRLAREADGGPAFDFLWYRRPPGAAEGAGGLATLTVDLAPTADERAELAAAVAERWRAAGEAVAWLRAPGVVEVVGVPFTGGTVELAVGGEAGGEEEREELGRGEEAGGPVPGGTGVAGGAELVRRVAGAGPAAVAGPRASFAVELTADGAALLGAAVEGGIEVLFARCDLTFEHRLGDVSLRVWADAERVHAFAAAEGAPRGAGLAERLVERRLAGIEIEAEQELPAQRRAELETLGRELLSAVLAVALFEPAGGLKPFEPAMSVRLNARLTQTLPLTSHYAATAPIDLGTPAERAVRVRRVDLTHGFFDLLDVRFYATADFASGPVAAAKATVRYDETTPSGERIRRTGELVFREGETAGRFRCDLAAPGLARFSYDLEVFYDGDPEPLVRHAGPLEAGAGAVVVLDLEGLGVLAVDVALAGGLPERVTAAVVELEHPASGRTRRMILDRSHPEESWREVVRERTGPVRSRVAWVEAGGRRIEEDWREAAGPRIALVPPAELEREAEVRLVAAGSFADLLQIVVDLVHPLPDASAPVERAQFAFTAPGESHVWRVPGADPSAFAYRVSSSLVLTSGQVVALPPVDSDRPVFVVSDPLAREVEVIGRRLDLGGAWLVALVALEAAQPGSRRTFTLSRREDRPRFRYRAAAVDGDGYRYQLTLVSPSGERVATPWRDGRGELLVLAPPGDA